MVQEELSIHMLTIQSGCCLHSGAKASDSSHEEQTGALCDTSGRLDDKARLKPSPLGLGW